MKKNPASQSGIFNVRVLMAVALISLSASLGWFSFAAPSPTGDTLSTSHRVITYIDSTGSPPNPSGVALSMPNCGPGDTLCSVFLLTIDPSVGVAVSGYDPTQYQIFMEWSWAVTAVDYDVFIENAAGTAVIARNQSTADPSSIILPTTTPPGVYRVVLALATGAPIAINARIELQPKPLVSGLCTPPANCTPPRFKNYSAGAGQADDAGEPSLGVDWNPNVASLKNTTPPTKLNTGGVAFFTSGPHEWRVNFDDCSSPAINPWEDVSAPFTVLFVLSDPIGFVDHYTSAPLGLAYPPPLTPGRIFTIDLLGGQGNSSGSFSDVDGNSYLPPDGGPGGMGGPGQGPDHETLGGGPYAGTPPVTASYPATGTKNAIYYASQNIVAEAQCSRSEDGGKTFGPAVPIFTPTQCTGGIHGHVKVAPDGTVYIPNSTCATTGNDGVAVSTDNGMTWTQNNVPGSTGSQDPSVGVGQNGVGKPAGNLNGTNTIYLGWTSGDGHAHVAHSGNRGATWTGDTDVGAPFGVTHAVFPVVVAGDDSRAAFSFVGTGDGVPAGVCNPYGAVLNCQNVWHLYVATTYDGGTNWVVVDATPDDPIQKGTVCLEGTTCAGGRNLLDFNDITVDAEGRILVGYADGCVNCNNTFDSQSAASHGTVTRQSGGRRLFAFFDPIEPMPPAAPQMLTAIKQSPSGALISWLQPDNGGSTITGYNVYRGTVSGGEIFLAHITGETNTKYFDPSPPSSGSVFYYAQAINGVGEGPHCREVSLSLGNPETECIPAGLTKLTDGAGDTSAALGIINTPAPPGSDLLKFQISQPYQSDGIPRLIFTITTDNGQSPQPTGSAWYVAFKIGANYKAVHMAWKPTSPTMPIFESYTPGPNNTGGVDGRFVVPGSEILAEATSNYIAPFNQVVIVVKASDLGLSPGNTISGFVSGVSQSTDPGAIVGAGATALFDEMPNGLGYTGSYTVDNNQVCRINLPPIAVLAAYPVGSPPGTAPQGDPPLAIQFDGSGSHDPDTAPPADTIASYTFDFGDGSAPVTQASPLITHTYTSNGEFPARLTVTDSRGKVSDTFAQRIIEVETPLDKVVSSKIHGGVPGSPFFVILFDPVMYPNGTSEIECRAPGPENDYTIIYTFGTEFTATGMATGVTVDGANTYVSSHAPGPGANQYTVHLTSSVPNARRHVIAINGMPVHNSSTTVNGGNATLSNVGTRFDLLLGDTSGIGNGLVNSTDVSQTQSESGHVLTNANFRNDVTANGLINSSDVSTTQGQSGTGLSGGTAPPPSKPGPKERPMPREGRAGRP